MTSLPARAARCWRTAGVLGLSFSSWLGLGGCDGGATPPGDAGIVHPRFELAEAPIALGAIPFPDDLYRQDGTIALGALPDEELWDPATASALRAALATLDGFGVASPVFVEVDGAIDPASLPGSPSDSLA